MDAKLDPAKPSLVRHSRPEHLVPACFGMCFTLIFNLALFASARKVELPFFDLQTVSRFVSILAFVGFTVLSRRGFSLMNRPKLLWFAAGATALGSLILYLTVGFSSVLGSVFSGVIALCGIILAVCGYSTTFLAWFEMLAGMSMDYAVLYYIVARTVSAGMRSLFSFVPQEAIQAAMIIMPILSTLCLLSGHNASKDMPYAQGEEIYPRWNFPWRPVALLTTFEFVLTLVTGFSGSGLGISIIGSLAGCLLVLAIVLVYFKRFDLKVTHFLALPLVLASMMCVLLGGSFSTPGSILAFAAHDIFLTFVYALLFDISFRRGVNSLWVFSLMQASVTVGILVSYPVRDAALSGGFTDILIAACVVLITVVFQTFLTNEDYSNAWGLRMAHDTHEAGQLQDNPEYEIPAATLEERCSRVARQYNLTRREEQILFMRLQGATHHDLEDQLVISNNTVKSHIRHIYRKMDVADLDAARAVVEAA
ncbi:MAG: helix-turn-helix transcriptional regulator [Coriobacteriales bacterium]|nr:helix-turn-helix transcriptional regulator [Coriobacteriales bacterium]